MPPTCTAVPQLPPTFDGAFSTKMPHRAPARPMYFSRQVRERIEPFREGAIRDIFIVDRSEGLPSKPNIGLDQCDVGDEVRVGGLVARRIQFCVLNRLQP